MRNLMGFDPVDVKLKTEDLARRLKDGHPVLFMLAGSEMNERIPVSWSVVTIEDVEDLDWVQFLE